MSSGLPYNPFLSGPNFRDQIEPGDHVVSTPAEDVPEDRFGFNWLVADAKYARDADLIYSAHNYLGFLAVVTGDDGYENDGDTLEHLVDENGALHLIHTRRAMQENVDIRA